MRHLCICLLLWLLVGVAHAAPPPPQWLPQESWPGGKQYDPRLERTVHFWDTGVPAAELFASITAQTGVPLGFSPPDDDNARICFNLYLNPQHPPTLRDLLAQLSWTLDCAWAVEGTGDQSRYLLLHTAIGVGVLEKIRQESEAAARRREEEESRAVAERLAAAIARLPELRAALRLSREAAIARYRGNDNALLLILLDPARRAAAQLYLSLAGPDLQAATPFPAVTRKWEELTPEQVSWAEEALGERVAGLAQKAREGRWFPGPRGPEAPGTPSDLEVSFPAAEGGFGMTVIVRNEARKAAGLPDLVDLGGASFVLSRDPRLEADAEGALRDESELRRLLGEEMDENEEQARAVALQMRRQSQQQRALLEQQLASLCRLSREATNRLAALRLPVKAGKEYALWQLQEAVAARSGMHVISDHFGQPPRGLDEALSLLHPEPEPDALALLQASCTTGSDREQLCSGVDQFATIAHWEWGDAGDFLRFRSADRDAWRAAFLPAKVVATLDRWLAPYLPRDLATATGAAVPLDVRQTGALLAELDGMQRLWGGALAYGSPLDETEQWRRAFRMAFTATTQIRPAPFYIMLSGLDDAQWDRLHTEGMRVGIDFIPRPDLTPDVWGRQIGEWLEGWKGQVLRTVPVDEEAAAPLREREGQWCELVLGPEGAPAGRGEQYLFATQLTIHPDCLPHLVGTGAVPVPIPSRNLLPSLRVQ